MLCITIVVYYNKESRMDNSTVQQFRKSIRKLERKLLGQLDGDTVCCGVTIAQCHVLLAVEEKGLTTITELATELELDKSTLSRTIDGLVTIGLVSRQTDAGNRRSQRISLTARGSEVTKRINGRWNDYFTSLFNRIPEAKHQAVLEGIALLAEAIRVDERCCEAKGCGTPADTQRKEL